MPLVKFGVVAAIGDLIMNKKIIMLFICIFTSIGMLAMAATTLGRVKLGNHLLMIPNKYMTDSGRPPSWLRFIPGMDNGSRELLLTIGSADVAKHIDGFIVSDGEYEDDIRVRISEITKIEKNRYLDPSQFSDAWLGIGSYSDAIVKTDPSSTFTRVYRKTEYPKSWELFKKFPSGYMPSDIYSVWVGHCIESHSPLTSNGKLALCKSYIILDDIAVNFTVSDENISKIDALRKYLSELVSTWMEAH